MMRRPEPTPDRRCHARFVVSAVSRESKGDTKNQFLIFVSVSRADGGGPGHTYSCGVQARTFAGKSRGQTAVAVLNTGT